MFSTKCWIQKPIRFRLRKIGQSSGPAKACLIYSSSTYSTDSFPEAINMTDCPTFYKSPIRIPCSLLVTVLISYLFLVVKLLEMVVWTYCLPLFTSTCSSAHCGKASISSWPYDGRSSFKGGQWPLHLPECQLSYDCSGGWGRVVWNSSSQLPLWFFFPLLILSQFWVASVFEFLMKCVDPLSIKEDLLTNKNLNTISREIFIVKNLLIFCAS